MFINLFPNYFFIKNETIGDIEDLTTSNIYIVIMQHKFNFRIY